MKSYPSDLPSGEIVVGCGVKYGINFLKSIGASNDERGTVVAINGKVARVEWDSGHVSSCLLSNLMCWPPQVPDSTPRRSQEAWQAIRALDIAIAWGHDEYTTRQ